MSKNSSSTLRMVPALSRVPPDFHLMLLKISSLLPPDVSFRSSNRFHELAGLRGAPAQRLPTSEEKIVSIVAAAVKDKHKIKVVSKLALSSPKLVCDEGAIISLPDAALRSLASFSPDVVPDQQLASTCCYFQIIKLLPPSLMRAPSSLYLTLLRDH
ncbi:hypothetical protein GOP47_0015900 [Adiantum capillus-veneris]|uniref:Uncharacterized protein n=1 Tax=Adiantum capillus-veneris TaxID=13818 RepID=A0A9D4UL54_ADICA|nr:hypothetical protein GOP47_0015900 [Adiantum capillus-veneris]